MATLEELRRERERLLNQRQAREDMEKMNVERRQLKSEIADLRSPGRVKVRNAAKSAYRGIGLMGRRLLASNQIAARRNQKRSVRVSRRPRRRSSHVRVSRRPRKYSSYF